MSMFKDFGVGVGGPAYGSTQNPCKSGEFGFQSYGLCRDGGVGLAHPSRQRGLAYKGSYIVRFEYLPE